MNKCVVITGAASGIGLATSVLLASHGWDIIGIDKNNHTGEFFSEFYECDVSDETKIQKVANEIVSNRKKVNGLVLCAAAQYVRPFNELSSEEWDHTYSVNVKSTWLLSKVLLPALEAADADWSSIVAVSSIHAVTTSNGLSAYASSKAALVGLVRSLAIELAGFSVRVNALIPGAVNTPMLTDHLTAAQIDKLASRQLIKRIAAPKEVAEVIEFLLTDKSSFITGQQVIVDGGVQMLLATEVD